MLLIRFTGERKNIWDFFPKINEPVERKPRKKITDDFPTPDYTDPRCLAIIKERDKQADAPYVKEFHNEIRRNLKFTKSKQSK